MSPNADPSPAPPPQEQGISLDELARAFAQVMGTAPKLHPTSESPPTADKAGIEPFAQETFGGRRPARDG